MTVAIALETVDFFNVEPPLQGGHFDVLPARLVSPKIQSDDNFVRTTARKGDPTTSWSSV